MARGAARSGFPALTDPAICVVAESIQGTRPNGSANVRAEEEMARSAHQQGGPGGSEHADLVKAGGPVSAAVSREQPPAVGAIKPATDGVLN